MRCVKPQNDSSHRAFIPKRSNFLVYGLFNLLQTKNSFFCPQVGGLARLNEQIFLEKSSGQPPKSKSIKSWHIINSIEQHSYHIIIHTLYFYKEKVFPVLAGFHPLFLCAANIAGLHHMFMSGGYLWVFTRNF
jgi:hypothetical protein